MSQARVYRPSLNLPLVFFGLRTSFCWLSRRTTGRTPFHPKQTLRGVTFNGPIRFPQHSCSVHDHGRQRSDREPQLLPAPTLAWLYIELSLWGGVRPAGDPVDSDPRNRLRGRSPPWIGWWSPAGALSVSPHPEPTILSRVSCRPFHLNIDRFHQPCVLPGRTSRIGEDCRLRTTWLPLTLFGQPGSSSFAFDWRFFCHAD